MENVITNLAYNKTELLKFFFDSVQGKFVFEISCWTIATFILLVIIVFLIVKKNLIGRKHFKLVKLDIKLGSFGKAEFMPVLEDVQIAHRIRTELVTRKAAITIDPEHDVIIEIYNSWYVLFGVIRNLISDIPAHLLREEKSTQELIRIATDTLNYGLRLHLTKWQARFRNWYDRQEEKLSSRSPQEVQKNFPEYDLLMQEMLQVNDELKQYADELNKIVHGHNNS